MPLLNPAVRLKPTKQCCYLTLKIDNDQHKPEEYRQLCVPHWKNLPAKSPYPHEMIEVFLEFTDKIPSFLHSQIISIRNPLEHRLQRRR